MGLWDNVNLQANDQSISFLLVRLDPIFKKIGASTLQHCENVRYQSFFLNSFFESRAGPNI